MGCASSRIARRRRHHRGRAASPIPRSFSISVSDLEDEQQLWKQPWRKLDPVNSDRNYPGLLKMGNKRVLGKRPFPSDAAADADDEDDDVYRLDAKKMIADMKVKKPLPEEEDEHVEVIWTSELMEGLEDRSTRSQSPSPLRSEYNATSVLGKHLPDGMIEGNDEEEEDGSCLSSDSTSQIRVKEDERCLRSAKRKRVSDGDFDGSSIPLFDPSIMAMVEKALEPILESADDEATSDSSSFINFTTSIYASSSSFISDSSSDADSPYFRNVPNQKGDPFLRLIMANSRMRESKSESEYGSDISNSLYSYELRCPPGGDVSAVLYFTSLRGVRKTYEDSCTLKAILSGLGIRIDERDVWMHRRFRTELTETLGFPGLIPQLFIKGRHIGGVEEVKELHEEGLLLKFLQELPPTEADGSPCEGCGDVRFIPCLTCNGSCKLIDEEGDTMRCLECNENGLMMCPICNKLEH